MKRDLDASFATEDTVTVLLIYLKKSIFTKELEGRVAGNMKNVIR